MDVHTLGDLQPQPGVVWSTRGKRLPGCGDQRDVIVAYGRASLKPADVSPKVEGSKPSADLGHFSALKISVEDYSYLLALEYPFITC